MRTLKEVLDDLDIQIIKNQDLVLLTKEDASTLAQALTLQLGKEQDEQAEDDSSYA